MLKSVVLKKHRIAAAGDTRLSNGLQDGEDCMLLAMSLGLITAAPAAVAPDDETALRQAEHQLAEVIAKGDAAFVERVFGERSVHAGLRGEVVSKADIVAELKSGELRFGALRCEDAVIRLSGDAAIVTGRATTKGRSAQGEISSVFR